MAWKKEPAWSGPIHQGCLNCAPVERVAPMSMLIVASGEANVTRDGKMVYVMPARLPEEKDIWTLAKVEAMAKADPYHDWRVSLVAALRDREYQRQGEGQWVLIASGEGYA